MPPTIFIVDSSPAVQRMVETVSSPQGYRVVAFHDGPTALEAARRLSPVLIFADYHLANMTFSGFCTEIGKSDNLADTMVISLAEVGDRLDERHLRTLGVRTFLTKPLHAEKICNALESLAPTLAREPASEQRPKRRTWPPDSCTTDQDDPSAASLEDEGPALSEPSAPTTQVAVTTPSAGPQRTAELPHGPHGTHRETEPEEQAMRGLLHYLRSTVQQYADGHMRNVLHRVVTQEVTALLPQVVREAMQRELLLHLTEERITAAARTSMAEELQRRWVQEWPAVEQALTQQVADLTSRLVREASERLLREALENELTRHVGAAVHRYLTQADSLIKQEIQDVTTRLTSQLAEDVVRKTALERVHNAVQRMVPDIAEIHIQEELRRLTAPE